MPDVVAEQVTGVPVGTVPAPKAEETPPEESETLATEETPAPETPQAETPKEELDLGVDITKLPPDLQKTAKQFQAAYTRARQKDASAVSQAKAEREAAAHFIELNSLLRSTDPGQRAQGVKLLETVLVLAKGEGTPGAGTETTDTSDPLAGIDEAVAELETYAPAAAKFVRSLAGYARSLEEKVGKTSTFVEATSRREAEQSFTTELNSVKAYAEKHGLPFDAKRIIDAENALGISNLQAAYFYAFRDEIPEAAKQAALKALKIKKDATLPAAPAAAAGTPTRPKFRTMLEYYEWAKRQPA